MLSILDDGGDTVRPNVTVEGVVILDCSSLVSAGFKRRAEEFDCPLF